MNTPRFNYNRGPGEPSRLSPRNYPKWIGVSHIDGPLLRDSKGSGRRKIFAIVAPSTRADIGYKTVRRVLIFDDHPDSLRLVSRQYLNPDVDLAAGRVRSTGGLAAAQQTSHSHVVLGLVLILALVLAMFLPLL